MVCVPWSRICIVGIVLVFHVLCWSQRQEHSTVSCCLPVTFLQNISCPHPSLQHIVSCLFFKRVLCFQALLLTQVQGCTRITSSSTPLAVPLPTPLTLQCTFVLSTNFYFPFILPAYSPLSGLCCHGYSVPPLIFHFLSLPFSPMATTVCFLPSLPALAQSCQSLSLV